ncbi:uncharacterized protein DNG_04673 [Cephalotrichum gorgonifer]|uniref:NB-ARC domain-containing protein n=1 Tax=Cephalotrichum gorgonifer TaxID=2041049 RepID=A0AAE8MX43_9PEZI|nr:uncharacterized protein DNG_04673 [Cephalotrichum gorgonifer]
MCSSGRLRPAVEIEQRSGIRQWRPLIQNVPPILEEDLGLRVLYDGTSGSFSREAGELVDIVAVHGMGAHPDDTWCQKFDGDIGDGPAYVSWLEDQRFLPAEVPRARIMRYGYNSRWFGEGAIKTKMSDISQPLLFDLNDYRKTCRDRPLILIGHSFGGLVILKTLVDSHTERNNWPHIYDSTVGLVFLGTPFRGTHASLAQGEILRRAQELFTESPVYGENLEVLRPGGESLTDLLDTYLRIARQSAMPRVACFYEQMASDVGRILGEGVTNPIPPVILVNESSGCLDLSERLDKYPLARTHFNIQTFGNPNHQGFRHVRGVIRKMADEGPELVSTRANCVRPRLCRVPFERNRYFIGREAILQQLLEQVDPYVDVRYCQRTVIEGLGGIGKTQIALEAAHRILDKRPNCSVFWVPATDGTNFENAYHDIGRELKIKGIDDDDADIKALVKAALSHQDSGAWLMIVDNADDKELLLDHTGLYLAQYLPSSKSGSILFTTRHHKVAVGQVNGEARDIIPVANLPLAIKQASAYMANQEISTVEYLDLCASSEQGQIGVLEEEYIDHHRYKDMANAIAMTWLISFRQISVDNRLAANYLRRMCFFAEKDIPLALLPPTTPPTTKKQLLEAIGTLKAYAFLTKRKRSDSYDIHRLVQIAVRNWLKENGERRPWSTAALRSIARVFPSPEHTNKEVWRRYLPHAQSVLQLQEVMADSGQTGLNFLSKVSTSFYIQGNYSEAEQIFRQTLELCQKVLGDEHPDTLGCSNLALMLERQNKYDKAESINRQTLELKKRVDGDEHPDTVGSMNNLALIFYKQGKYNEAKEMHQQTLELRKKVLGDEHPDTFGSMNNFALVLARQGEYKEAEAIHRQTLELRKKVIGDEHPDTLMSMNNLAFMLASQGKHNDAEVMHQQTLDLRMKVLGDEHPDTLRSIDNLVYILERLGKCDEAKQIRMLSGKMSREEDKVLGDK